MKLVVPSAPGQTVCPSSVGEEIGARASLAAVRGRWISCGPENLIGHRIVSARIPCRRAANFPRIAFPCVITQLARPRHGVETPAAFSSGSVVGVNKSAHAVFTARYADHHEILHSQRSHGETVSSPVVGGD